MKKLFYLLLLLPFSLLASCDKDDMQPFDMTVTLSGVTQANGNFYAISGNDITVENLSVTPLGDKATTVANVLFYVNTYPLFPDPWDAVAPLTFSTQNLPEGANTINVAGNLLQVGQPINTFAANFNLIVVPSAEDLPAGAPELGTYSQTITFSK